MKHSAARPWSKDKVEILTKLWPHFGTITCADMIGLTKSQIKSKADRLKLKILPKQDRLCVQCMTNTQVNRDCGLKCRKCYNENRIVTRPRSPLVTFWNDERMEFLKKWYPQLGGTYVANQLYCSIDKVFHKAHHIGLRLLPSKDRLCRECKTLKLGTSSHGRICAICTSNKRKNKRDKTYADPRSRLSELLRQMRVRSSVKCDVTVDYLLDLWKSQDGKCFYSGLEMTLTPSGLGRSPYSLSIDQKVPKAGYTKGNIALCCWAINAGKQNFSIDTYIKICRAVAKRQSTSRRLSGTFSGTEDLPCRSPQILSTQAAITSP